MFNRFSQWFKEQKAWKVDHIRTWEGMTSLDDEGISKFQREALSAIESLQVKILFQRHGETEAYYQGIIPNTEIEVFIYSDGAQVTGETNLFRAEEWDCRTPNELIEQLRLVILQRAQAT